MTIKEVAQLAGVSSAAVSRYINGGSLSDQKREKIRKAIELTGYRPNLMARSMRTGRGGQVGVIVPKIHSDSVSAVMAGISDTLAEAGYMTLLGNAELSDEKEIRYLDLMKNNQVAGIVLMAGSMTPEKEALISEMQIPVVITGQNFEGMPCVYHNDYHAAAVLTEHMIARGRKKIAYIGVTERDLAAGLARRLGVQLALREAGMESENIPRRIGEFNAESGRKCMTELLEKVPDLDGVICATDAIALGAMRTLKDKGRKVPEDVSVAGIGDSWAGRVSNPALTTIRLDFRGCGEKAARLLLDIIGGKTAGRDSREMLPFELLERESV